MQAEAESQLQATNGSAQNVLHADPRSLEQRRQERIEFIQAQRAVWWRLADMDAAMVRDFGRGVIPSLASDEGCSSANIRDRLQVAYTFPLKARHPDILPSIYLLAMRAASRTGEAPEAMIERAVTERWKARDLRMVGDECAGYVQVLDRICDGCGYEFVIRRERDKEGLKTQVHCDVCRTTRGEVVPLGMIR